MTIEQFQTVFLDRDGVLNRKLPEGQYVGSLAQFEPLPGVEEAIVRLNRAGKLVIVVSNQRGIALGLYTAADVEEIHAAFQEQLGVHGARIDGFFYCPHDDNECNCRKPFLGLFEQAAEQFPQITPQSSVMIGDSLSDIEFGVNLGLGTILIDDKHSPQKSGMERACALADCVCGSLTDCVDFLLGQ
ncbi:MAG TPA: HAD family hydrolase [Terracidiphilus sp.]|nr:HAD family hydrolase [Terracidiphilus sp.]